MRNLKRVLSLALASVMLMGMMVVGSSAAFKDADKIVNTEAVGIAGGLGLFAGDTEGNFNPEGTVTRAQMAAVIAKMFYGSQLNADTYKGGNKFTDTASFEGGWAEGYINLGVEKGWFKGYGDGTFKPGQAVTTAEAMTMIVNLLGIDAGEGTWPMTVMAAVEENSLFNDVVELETVPATNAPMTRDQLSVAVVNGLYYSAEGVQGYTYKDGTIVFKTWTDAHEYATKKDGAGYDVKNIKEVKGDTLADTVFEIVEIEGYITKNQATGEDYTLVGSTKLDIVTGLDMLGHHVKAYYAKEGEYKTEKNRGTAYSVVDTAEYFTVDAPIAKDKKAYTAVFGGKIELGTVNAFAADGKAGVFGSYDEDLYIADAGTYGVDKESGKIVTFIAPAAISIEEVGVVKTVAGKESIKIGSTIYENNADKDVIVEYEGIAEGDIVAVKAYRWNASTKEGMIYVEKLEPVTGKIEATTQGKLNGNAVTYITIDGKEYLESSAAFTVNVSDIKNTYTISATNVYDAYVYGDKLIGAELVAGAGKLEDAIFVVNNYTLDVNTGYGVTAHYYAQGVNAAGEEVSILVGIDNVNDAADDAQGLGYTAETSVTPGQFYNFEKSLDRDQAKKDIMYATPAQGFDADGDGFHKDIDGYFAVNGAATITANKLEKEDKYLLMGSDIAANRLFVTDSTKFIVVERPTGVDELEIATYTGPIAKVLNLTATADQIFVAAMGDANGTNKAAELVVILTDKLNLAIEDYVYIAADATYSITADGIKYNGIYFTETEEFKAVTLDGTAPYGDGFYEIDEIDEDGVYHLNSVTNVWTLKNLTAKGVYGNSLIVSTTNEDMYALAEDAKIYDVRSEKWLEESEVSEIATLKDIATAIKGSDPYTVTFDLLLEDVDATTKQITHIFVKSITKGGSEI